MRAVLTRTALLIGVSFAPMIGSAQDPIKAYPKNYSVAFDNDAVTVIRVHYGPHEKVGVHDHSSYPTVFVYLSSSGPVHFQHAGDKTSDVTRPPTVKGAYRVTPGMVERHSVENLGDASSDFLRVELKQVPAQGPTAFRGSAPMPPLKSGDTVEYSVPSVQIERIVCAEPTPCPIDVSPSPSLLIAFDPASEMTGIPTAGDGQRRVEKLDAGDVRWLPAGHSAEFEPDSSDPAHLLRIILPVTAPPKP